MKVWVTKYALTSGIEEVEVEETHTPAMVCAKTGTYIQAFYGEGREWHRHECQAKIHADTMRKKKIESLKKSIAKLEKMRF